ncbi:hypothetical protein [Fibrobacter sp. UWP2]|uniref:hypothetical protein n=1 Tax=Fibrobacter sp. UWP2 TaxID=1896216 RepID=UPI000910DB08|nr:hypothetical protein [Fibrobacter sp. UWP2]SHJ27440.1 hypothetical protein SAMN05720471_12451 [Fibrobacter sp. UWP2]
MNLFKNKILMALASASLVFGLAACDDSSSASADEPTSSSSVEKEKDKSSSSKAKDKSSSSKKEEKSSSSVKDDAKSSSSVEEKKEESKYLLSFMMETSQFVGIAPLSADQKKIVKDFIEAPNAGSVAYFNGSVYVLATDDAMNSTLSRYEVKDLKMADEPAATAKFTGTNAIAMKFLHTEKSDGKLYVEQALGDAITVVDIKTLKTVKTIDLSEYIDEESGALSTVPGSAVIDGKKMYVSLNQFVDFNNMIAGPRGSVAIIDLNKDEVEKVIYTDQVAALGGMDDMNGTASFVDEKGDIYFYSNASYSFIEGYKEGWVRIKSGESEFDKDWVFRMHDAAYDGKKTNNNSLMVGGTYMGNGKFFGFFGTFADPTNFNNYEWEFVVVDVYKKTVEKVKGLTPTIPWFAPSIHRDADGKSVLVGHADSKGGAIYRYDIASGKVTKEMDVTTGTAYYIVPVVDYFYDVRVAATMLNSI